MLMSVGMPGARGHRLIVRVLMMLIVFVLMLVLHRLVRMLVFMAFRYM